jgi:thiol-disulfide isomerase/thioredoxin
MNQTQLRTTGCRIIVGAAAFLGIEAAFGQSLAQLRQNAQADPAQLEMPEPPASEPAGFQLDEMDSTPLRNGDAAPNFILKDLAGVDTELAKLRGKVVLVEFWATWCPPCKASMPKLKDIHTQYKDKGLIILAISLDHDQSALDAYLKDNPVPFKVLYDAPKNMAVADTYVVETIPRSFVVGKDGKLVLANGTPQKEAELAAAIETALLAP